MLSATVATPLALVLTELLPDAVSMASHRQAARLSGPQITACRSMDQLIVTVADNGTGFPDGFDVERAPSLGLQIVRTLVVGELGGTLAISARPEGGGTCVRVELPLPVSDQAG
jgi:two-component sensor histidine kinase